MRKYSSFLASSFVIFFGFFEIHFARKEISYDSHIWLSAILIWQVWMILGGALSIRSAVLPPAAQLQQTQLQTTQVLRGHWTSRFRTKTQSRCGATTLTLIVHLTILLVLRRLTLGKCIAVRAIDLRKHGPIQSTWQLAAGYTSAWMSNVSLHRQ